MSPPVVSIGMRFYFISLAAINLSSAEVTDATTKKLCSASAFFVTQTLRGLARDGRTVIASVHQPSSEVFLLFDCLYLLSGGKTVYFGKASEACEVCNNMRLLIFFLCFCYTNGESESSGILCMRAVLRPSWFPMPADAQPIGSFPQVHKFRF